MEEKVREPILFDGHVAGELVVVGLVASVGDAACVGHAAFVGGVAVADDAWLLTPTRLRWTCCVLGLCSTAKRCIRYSSKPAWSSMGAAQ